MRTKKVICLLLAMWFCVSVGARDLQSLQNEFLKWKFGMFIHFNMSTFDGGTGWASGKKDPSIFNPEHLDVGQWADAAVSAKMKYAILTVKHTGGWCLWDTDLTDHDITAFKNYKEGKGDLVREFVDTFRERGLKVGLYYCFPLWDSAWTNYWTLPMDDYVEETGDALGFVKAQFKELLTRYGKIDLVWIDQSECTHGGLKDGDWIRFKAYIHTLQPDCLVIGNNTKDFERSDIFGYEYPYALELPPLDNQNPVEVCDKLNKGWFASVDQPAPPVRSIDYVVNRLLRPLNDRHSNYLLNCSPESTGLFNEKTVAMLKEIGRIWDPNEPSHKADPLYGILRSTISKVPTEKNEVGLIFPPSFTPKEMLQAAEKLFNHGASGTFFVREETAKKGEKIFDKLLLRRNELGNGSRSTTLLSDLKTGLEIGAEVRAVSSILGTDFPLTAFRAPQDQYNDLVWDVLNYFNLIPVQPSKELVAGAIIEVPTPDQLDAILKALKQKNLKPVTVSQLMLDSSSPRLKSLASDATAKVVSGAR